MWSFSNIVIFIFILVFLLYIFTKGQPLSIIKFGGLSYIQSSNIVVDTLNLVHWMHGGKVDMSEDLIIETINYAAPILKSKYPGRVMFVTKDRNSSGGKWDSSKMQKIAEKNGIYIYSVENYELPPKGVEASSSHSASGRDDFYMAILARQYKCRVCTGDHFGDFNEFRATVQPFHVYEYAFWRAIPDRIFIKPDPSWASLRKPYTMHPSTWMQPKVRLVPEI